MIPPTGISLFPEEVVQVAVAPSLTEAAGYIFDSGNNLLRVETCLDLIMTIFSVEGVAFHSQGVPVAKLVFLLGQSLCLCPQPSLPGCSLHPVSFLSPLHTQRSNSTLFPSLKSALTTSDQKTFLSLPSMPISYLVIICYLGGSLPPWCPVADCSAWF